jgi:hypothetical protein
MHVFLDSIVTMMRFCFFYRLPLYWVTEKHRRLIQPYQPIINETQMCVEEAGTYFLEIFECITKLKLKTNRKIFLFILQALEILLKLLIRFN